MIWLMAGLLGATSVASAESTTSPHGPTPAPAAGYVRIDRLEEPVAGTAWVSFRKLQDLPPVMPQVQQPATPSAQTPAQRATTTQLFAGVTDRSNLFLGRRRRKPRTAADIVLGIESAPRAASDVGSLLSKSARSRGVTSQKRNPIITDPRIRGSRVGQLAASGSHWVPARIDLDTLVSKVDSRIIDDVTVIKGPYASRYGPGLSFLDINLLDSPRSDSRRQFGGSTGLEYQTNGEHWYGRQTGAVADEDWGFRFGYGHRTGTDYETGDGSRVSSSFKSRDIDVAFGRDFDGQNIEAYVLRQDQTDVELAGQAFDLDASLTNAFGATWTDDTTRWADRLEIETWYNDTRLKGNAQSPAKRQMFPYLDTFDYVGLTNVDSLSTGARAEASWELQPDQVLAIGLDVRAVRQELEEFSSGVIPNPDPGPTGQFPSMDFPNQIVFSSQNSPIPKSALANPGVYLELTDDRSERFRMTGGVRGDVVTTEMLASTDQLSDLGIPTFDQFNVFTNQVEPVSLADILGTGEFDQSYGLWSAYANAEYDLARDWTLQLAAGHGQRAPSLTELYAAESFMFLLQNGLNTVTGDPLLNPERQTQIDLGLAYRGDRLNFGLNGFYAWVNDRITFERFGTICNGNGQVEQVHLKYVNTDLATLIGFDVNLEYELAPDLVAFGTVGYVEGTDRTRNGDFATVQRQGFLPSVRFSGIDPSGTDAAVRGSAQNGFGPFTTPSPLPSPTANLPGIPCDPAPIGDVPHEPLPGIPPLEARAGIRVSGRVRQTQATVELSVRMVDSQHLVASTLLEMPTPGFVTCDLRSAWQINQNMTLVAGVENLTDEDYREHFDFLSATGQSFRRPGINFYFGSQIAY